jgi:hypothetical protein
MVARGFMYFSPEIGVPVDDIPMYTVIVAFVTYTVTGKALDALTWRMDVPKNKGLNKSE